MAILLILQIWHEAIVSNNFKSDCYNHMQQLVSSITDGLCLLVFFRLVEDADLELAKQAFGEVLYKQTVSTLLNKLIFIARK